MPWVLVFVLVARLAFSEIPPVVIAESNLEKRSDLALKAADEAISAASKTYVATGELSSFESHLKSVEDLTRLSLKSLHDSGKRASRSPKYFKRAEMKLRSLLRRMETLTTDVSAEDRPRVEAVKKVMSETHEQILHDIMSKK